jgi:histidinol dehydrogenase
MQREALVYPVYSRRSSGLSLGIDPFSGRFFCNFDCVYCEVPLGAVPGAPAREAPEAFRASLRAELEDFFDTGGELLALDPLRDICVAGSGEPTLSPHLGICLEEAARARRSQAAARGAKLVLITNGTRLGNEGIARLLGGSVEDEGLEVWVKLDAGSEARFHAVNRPRMGFEALLEGILSFARAHPVVIQTMLLSWEGAAPGRDDYEAYRAALEALLRGGARLLRVQLYTVTRLAREPSAAPVPDALLREWEARLGGDIPGLRIEAFGEAGRLEAKSVH